MSEFIKANLLQPTPPQIATDDEFAQGTSDTLVPSIKQVKSSSGGSKQPNSLVSTTFSIDYVYDTSSSTFTLKSGSNIDVTTTNSFSTTADLDITLDNTGMFIFGIVDSITSTEITGLKAVSEADTKLAYSRIFIYKDTTTQGLTFPIAYVSYTSTVYPLTSIGVCKNVVFVRKGVTFLGADGINQDGTYNTPEIKTSALQVNTYGEINTGFYLDSKGFISVNPNESGAFNSLTGYNTFLGTPEKATVLLTHFIYKDEDGLFYRGSQVTNQGFPSSYIMYTYKNKANWYRIWSDGWLEQGGVAEFTAGTDFNLPYTGGFVDYYTNIQLTPIDFKGEGYSVSLGNYSPRGFVLNVYKNGTATSDTVQVMYRISGLWSDASFLTTLY